MGIEEIPPIQGPVNTVQETIIKFEERFQNLVIEAQAFSNMHEQIMMAFDNSVQSVRSGDSKVEDVTIFIQDFNGTFAEVLAATHQISDKAEELSLLNHELLDKFEVRSFYNVRLRRGIQNSVSFLDFKEKGLL